MTLNVEKGKQGFQETEKSEPSSLSLGNQDLGDETAVTPTDPAVYVDPYPGRKGNERVSEACGKCNGTGIYTAPTGFTDKYGKPYCFDCSGTGKRTFLVSSARSTAKRRIKANAEVAERADTFAARNDDAETQLMSVPGFKEALEADVDTREGLRANGAAWEAIVELRDRGDFDSAADAFDYSMRRRFLPKLVGVNKWAKPCVACGVKVPTGDGVLGIREDRETGDVWETYCGTHVPTDCVDARRT